MSKQFDPNLSVNWFAAGTPGGHLNLPAASTRTPDLAAARTPTPASGCISSNESPSDLTEILPVLGSAFISLYLRLIFCLPSPK